MFHIFLPRIYKYEDLPYLNPWPYDTIEVSLCMNEKVAQRIKQLRLKTGISQEGLSHLAELDRKYIGIIEKGNTNISIQVLSQICEALDISLLEFFRGF